MSVATPSLKNFFTTQEAAEELGITDSLVRRYIRQGRIAAEQVGKLSYLIPRKTLEAFKNTPRKPGPQPD